LREEGGVGGGVGEGGGGRRDEQSLPSMLGRTASIFFADVDGVVGRRHSGHCYIEIWLMLSLFYGDQKSMEYLLSYTRGAIFVLDE